MLSALCLVNVPLKHAFTCQPSATSKDVNDNKLEISRELLTTGLLSTYINLLAVCTTLVSLQNARVDNARRSAKPHHVPQVV